MSSVQPAEPKKVNISEVSFGMSVNIGNYESVRFDLTAPVEPDQDWRETMAVLRRRSEKLRRSILEERGLPITEVN